LFAPEAARGDGPADGFLVAVRGGGVDGPVAGSQRVGNDLLGLLVGDLEDAEPEDRHLHAVVQRDQAVLWRHDSFLPCQQEVAHRIGGGGSPMASCCPLHETPNCPRQAVTVYPGNARPSLASRSRRTVADMDNRDEVRDFLTSRRERLSPEQAGVPFFGGR